MEAGGEKRYRSLTAALYENAPLEAVQELMAEEDVNKADWTGQTALFHALEHKGDSRVFQAVLDGMNSAAILAKDSNRLDVLQYALRRGRREAVVSLAERQQREKELKLFSATCIGHTRLHSLFAGPLVADKEIVDLVAELVPKEHFGIPPTEGRDVEDPPLVAALASEHDSQHAIAVCLARQPNMAQLIEQGCEPLTFVSVAAEYCSLDVVQQMHDLLPLLADGSGRRASVDSYAVAIGIAAAGYDALFAPPPYARFEFAYGTRRRAGLGDAPPAGTLFAQESNPFSLRQPAGASSGQDSNPFSLRQPAGASSGQDSNPFSLRQPAGNTPLGQESNPFSLRQPSGAPSGQKSNPFSLQRPSGTVFGGEASSGTPFAGPASLGTPFGGSAGTSFGGSTPSPTASASSESSGTPFGSSGTPLGGCGSSGTPFGSSGTPFGSSGTPCGNFASSGTPFGAGPATGSPFGSAPEDRSEDAAGQPQKSRDRLDIIEYLVEQGGEEALAACNVIVFGSLTKEEAEWVVSRCPELLVSLCREGGGKGIISVLLDNEGEVVEYLAEQMWDVVEKKDVVQMLAACETFFSRFGARGSSMRWRYRLRALYKELPEIWQGQQAGWLMHAIKKRQYLDVDYYLSLCQPADLATRNEDGDRPADVAARDLRFPQELLQKMVVVTKNANT